MELRLVALDAGKFGVVDIDGVLTEVQAIVMHDARDAWVLTSIVGGYHFTAIELFMISELLYELNQA